MAAAAKRLTQLCSNGRASENIAVIHGLTDIIRKFHAIPKVSSVHLSCLGSTSKSYSLKVNWSHDDLNAVEAVEFHTRYLIQLDNDGLVDLVTDLQVVQNVSSESYSLESSHGRWLAVVKEITKDGKSSQVLEFWSNSGKVKTIDGAKEKSFGKIHLSRVFGSISWSPDESMLMLVAEKYRQSEGFFGDKKKTEDKNGQSKGDEDKTNPKADGLGTEYELKVDWGEQLEGSCHPVIVIVDVNDDFKTRIIEVPSFSCSDTFWIGSKKIGFVGLKEESRRLGLMFCPIRKSQLFTCDLRDPESEPDVLYGADQELAIRSPRVSPDFQKLVFLSNPCGGPHDQSSSLHLMNFGDKSVRTLIDSNLSRDNIIDSPTEIGSFYAESLPQDCWTSDSKKIISTCQMGYRSHLFIIDCDDGSSTRISVQGAHNISIKAIKNDLLVLNSSQPDRPNYLMVGKLVHNELVSVKPVDENRSFEIDSLDHRTHTMEVTHPADGSNQVITSIIVGKKDLLDQPSATVLIPHGGPHGTLMSSYSNRIAIMCEVGFKVILINYRGSTGISSRHERSLCGRVGSLDVFDCVNVLKHYIGTNQVDPKQVHLWGWSHGGFLVTHLIGQHADMGFKSCVAGNPVTDLASGFSSSDIPDWHLVEGHGSMETYPLTTIPTSQTLSDLLAVSPIAHIDKVKTPVLMILGTKDQRVVFNQGRNYHYGLKARGIETRCLVYEDTHGCQKLPHDLDVTMNSLLWFLDHL